MVAIFGEAPTGKSKKSAEKEAYDKFADPHGFKERPGDNEEMKRAIKRLTLTKAKMDSTNVEALKRRKASGKPLKSLTDYQMFDDKDFADSKDRTEIERHRVGGLREGRSTLKFAETGQDSSDVESMRDRNIPEEAIARRLLYIKKMRNSQKK